MHTIVLHTVIKDEEKKEWKIKEAIEVDVSEIESVQLIRSVGVKICFPKTERRKVPTSSMGACVSNVALRSGETFWVIESQKYIRDQMREV